MDEQCKAALDLLVQNGYLEVVKGKYRPTKKLNTVSETVVAHTSLGPLSFEGSWEDFYTKFIVDCKIPRKGESADGTLYDLNKYSEEAMKRFKEMVTRDGIKYDVLMRVVQAYYKGGTRCKKNISNYIIEGFWRMDYMALKDQSTEQQQQTLQKQVDESKPFTRDRIG